MTSTSRPDWVPNPLWGMDHHIVDVMAFGERQAAG